MNISETTKPNSQQVNAEDLLSRPRTVTITSVEKGTDEQPVFIHTAEFPDRTYRPSKSMRRVLEAIWGEDTDPYTGRGLTLFRNPEITFGREKTGGIEISHMTHIEKPVQLALMVSRGKRKPFIVQPLVLPKQRDWLQEIEQAAGNVDALRALGNAALEAKAAPGVITAIRTAVNNAAKEAAQ